MKHSRLLPHILALATLVAAASSSIAADLRLSPVFGNHMVARVAALCR